MPIVKVRPRTLKRRLTLVGLGAIAAAGILAQAAPAHADTIGEYAFRNATSICGVLDNDPSPSGVIEVGTELVAHGLSPHDAAAVTVLAVYNVCPKYLPLLHSGPSDSTVAQVIA